jgi:hypothetical protein
MNLDLVISQIRTLVPFFAGNVAGAAAYANGVDAQVWLPTPAAYVVPLDGEATPNGEEAGLVQMLTERVNIIVQFDNSADRRGQSVTELYQSTLYAIFRAILNWRPNSSVDNPGVVVRDAPGNDVSAKGLYLVSEGLVDFDRARLFYRFTFGLDSMISDSDGWQPFSEPLRAIKGTITSPTSGEDLASFETDFPPP